MTSQEIGHDVTGTRKLGNPHRKTAYVGEMFYLMSTRGPLGGLFSNVYHQMIIVKFKSTWILGRRTSKKRRREKEEKG